jgi:biopolymer transport protein ExbD
MTRFEAHRRKRARAIKPAAAPMASINVTPLVDVVLVLLIIFMVVTPLLDKKLDVIVPQSKEVESKDELPIHQLMVHLSRTGKLMLNEKEVGEEEYFKQLKERLALLLENNRVVFIGADEDARYDLLVRAIDRAKQAGATAIGMSTEEPQ